MAHGHPLVVDRDHRLAEDPLDDEHALGEADVGELRRAGDEVADGPDVLLVRLLELVGDDEPALVEQDVGPLAQQPLGPGSAADGDDDCRGSTSAPSASCTVVPVPSGRGRCP